MLLGVKQYHQHLLENGRKRYNGEIQEKVYGQCCWRGSLHLLNMKVTELGRQHTCFMLVVCRLKRGKEADILEA